MLITCYGVTCDAERMYFQCLNNMKIDLDGNLVLDWFQELGRQVDKKEKD